MAAGLLIFDWSALRNKEIVVNRSLSLRGGLHTYENWNIPVGSAVGIVIEFGSPPTFGRKLLEPPAGVALNLNAFWSNWGVMKEPNDAGCKVELRFGGANMFGVAVFGIEKLNPLAAAAGAELLAMKDGCCCCCFGCWASVGLPPKVKSELLELMAFVAAGAKLNPAEFEPNSGFALAAAAAAEKLNAAGLVSTGADSRGFGCCDPNENIVDAVPLEAVDVGWLKFKLIFVLIGEAAVEPRLILGNETGDPKLKPFSTEDATAEAAGAAAAAPNVNNDDWLAAEVGAKTNVHLLVQSSR